MGKSKNCIVMFFDNSKNIWSEGPKFASVKEAKEYIRECRALGYTNKRYISAR